MKKTLFVLTTIILVFNSCKKDKLTGDAMDLIGECVTLPIFGQVVNIQIPI